MTIHLFHHVVDLPNSEYILSEQIQRIITSGILEKSTTYHICVNGNIHKLLPVFKQLVNYNNVQLIHVAENCLAWEYYTLSYLKYFIDNQTDDSKVAYIHMKGASRMNSNVDDWRRLMEYFIIDNHNQCIELLDSGHDIVGINYLKGMLNWHFSGNFWWSTSAYIKSLQPVPDPHYIMWGTTSPITGMIYQFDSFRYDHECWITTGDYRHKELFNSQVDHYHSPYPESNYRNENSYIS